LIEDTESLRSISVIKAPPVNFRNRTHEARISRAFLASASNGEDDGDGIKTTTRTATACNGRGSLPVVGQGDPEAWKQAVQTARIAYEAGTGSFDLLVNW
jgi:hypothetical protein